MHLSSTILSTICSILYSWPPIPDTFDPVIKEIKECMTAIEFAAVPGTYLIDTIRWLLYIPHRLSKWKKEGAYWYDRNTSVFEGIMDNIQRKRAEVSCHTDFFFRDYGGDRRHRFRIALHCRCYRRSTKENFRKQRLRGRREQSCE
jgi:hypothetical protein